MKELEEASNAILRRGEAIAFTFTFDHGEPVEFVARPPRMVKVG
jgi:hypothetical protein